MSIDQALAIVREEGAFCRSLAEKDGKNIGGDFAAFVLRKAGAEEAVCAEVERLSVSLDEEVAVGNWKFTEGFAWTAEREEEFREEWRREHAT